MLLLGMAPTLLAVVGGVSWWAHRDPGLSGFTCSFLLPGCAASSGCSGLPSPSGSVLDEDEVVLDDELDDSPSMGTFDAGACADCCGSGSCLSSRGLLSGGLGAGGSSSAGGIPQPVMSWKLLLLPLLLSCSFSSANSLSMSAACCSSLVALRTCSLAHFHNSPLMFSHTLAPSNMRTVPGSTHFGLRPSLSPLLLKGTLYTYTTSPTLNVILGLDLASSDRWMTSRAVCLRNASIAVCLICSILLTSSPAACAKSRG